MKIIVSQNKSKFLIAGPNAVIKRETKNIYVGALGTQETTVLWIKLGYYTSIAAAKEVLKELGQYITSPDAYGVYTLPKRTYTASNTAEEE